MNIDRNFWKRLTGKQFMRNQNVAIFFGEALVTTFPQRIYFDSG